MKKIICITLAVIMVLAACPMTLLAAATSTAAGDAKITSGVATIWYTDENGNYVTEENTYDTLDAAVDALGTIYAAVDKAALTDGNDADTTIAKELYAAAGRPVIKLNGNFDGAATSPSWVSKANYDPHAHYTVVIDGARSETENYTITCGAVTLFSHLAWYDFTIKNTNIIFNRGTNTSDNNILWEGNGLGTLSDDRTENDFRPGESFTLFENCVIDQNSDVLSNITEGGLFKLNGAAKATKDKNGDGIIDDPYDSDKFNLTLKDCTINTATAVGLQVHWGADANVSLVNTEWTLDGPNGDQGNDVILKAYETGDVNFNIDGNSKLITARDGSVSTSATHIRVLRTLGGEVNINLESGAELRAANNSTAMTSQNFVAVEANPTSPVYVNDYGAVYTVSPAAAKIGVNLFYFVDKNQKTKVWTVNGEGTDATQYKDANATEDAVLRTGGVSATDNVAIMDSEGEIYAGYVDLFDAVKAARNTDTILVYKDITLPYHIGVTSYDPENLRDITIIGIKRTDGTFPTVTADKGFAFGMALYNLTVKNLVITGEGSFNSMFDHTPVFVNEDGSQNWSPDHPNSGGYINDHVGSRTVIENCTVTAEASSGTGFMLKAKGGNITTSETSVPQVRERYFISVSNSDLSVTNKDNFMLNNSCAQTYLTFTDCNITHTNTGGNNAQMFNMETNGVNRIAFLGENTITENANSDTTDYSTIFNLPQAVGTLVVDLSDQTTLVWNGATSKTGNKYIAGDHVVVNNYGATYKFDANIANLGNGVTLPNNYHNGTICDYTDGTTTYSGVKAAHKLSGAATVTTTDTVSTEVGSNAVINTSTRTFYADLAAAVSAAGNNAKLVVIKDNSFTNFSTGTYTKTTDGVNTTYAENISIIGAKGGASKHTVTSTAAVYNYCGVSGYDNCKVAIMDLNFVQYQGIGSYGGLLVIDGCDITTTSSMVLRLLGGNYHKVDLVNTTWTSTSAEPFIHPLDKNDLDADIRLINSDLLMKNNRENVHEGNSSFIFSQSKGTINIWADGDSSMLVDSEATGTYAYSGFACLFPYEVDEGTAFNLYLAEGARVGFTGMPNNKTNIRFLYAKKDLGMINFPIYIEDRGAEWLFETDVGVTSTANVYFPEVYDKDGNLKEFTLNGEAVDAYPFKSTGNVSYTFKTESVDTLEENESYIGYIQSSDKKLYVSSLQLAVNYLDEIYSAVTTEGLTNEALWTAAGSPEIFLYRDFETTSTVLPSWYTSKYDPERVRTVIISSAKANDAKTRIDSLSGYVAIRGNSYYNLTLNRIDLRCPNGMAIFWGGYDGDQNSAASTTNINDCYIEAVGTDSTTRNDGDTYWTNGEGLVFKITGNENDTHTENYTININRTEVLALEGDDDKDGINAVFLFHHGAAGQLNIDGETKITHYNNRNAAGGDTMFMLGSNRRFEINVASGAELTAYANGTCLDTPYTVFSTQNSNVYYENGAIRQTVNIAGGAKLSINAGESYEKPVYFIRNSTTANSGGTAVNMGEGVEMTVNAKAAANGFGMALDHYGFIGSNKIYGADITVEYESGKTEKGLYGYTVNAGHFVKDGDTIKSITMIPATSNRLFEMQYGAALRTFDGSGIRFTTTVPENIADFIDELEADGVSVEVGTLIGLGRVAPLITAGNSVVKIPSRLALTTDELGNTVYRAALIHIPETEYAYDVELSGRSYMKLTYPDGSSTVLYSDFDNDSNTRSLYQIANNIMSDDELKAKLDATQLAAVTRIKNTKDYSPINTLDALGSATVIESGVYCTQYIYSDVTLETAISALEAKGYTRYAVTNVDTSKFQTVVMANEPYVVTMYYIGTELRVMVESDVYDSLWLLSSHANTDEATFSDVIANPGVGGVGEIVQLGTERVGQTDDPLIGLWQIIKLDDGRAIIIDGGYDNEATADNILRALEELDILRDSENRFQIAAWIFTHGHGDHIGGAQAFARKYHYRATIEYVIHNLAQNRTKGNECDEAKFLGMMKSYYPYTRFVDAHANLKYYIGNATISMLYTPDLVYTADKNAIIDYNDTSLVFKVEIGGQSVLYFADAGENPARTMEGLYGANTFKSSAFQITHHGLSTGYDTNGTALFNSEYLLNLYEMTGAKIAFLPMGSDYLPEGTTAEKDGNNGRGNVIIKNIDKYGNNYHMYFIVNMNDNSGVGYDQFCEYDENRTVAGNPSTIRGYDRTTNTISNGKGLTTYIASDTDSHWVTRVTFTNESMNVTYHGEFDAESWVTNP